MPSTINQPMADDVCRDGVAMGRQRARDLVTLVLAASDSRKQTGKKSIRLRFRDFYR